jgi:hypothetical protein
MALTAKDSSHEFDLSETEEFAREYSEWVEEHYGPITDETIEAMAHEAGVDEHGFDKFDHEKDSACGRGRIAVLSANDTEPLAEGAARKVA